MQGLFSGGRRMPAARSMVVMLAGFLLLMATMAPASFAAAPNPSEGSANVDGDTGDWSLGADFFADMTDAGRADQPVRAKFYLRYDCDEEVLYGLVLVQGDEKGRQTRTDEAFLRINGGSGKLMSAEYGDDGTPPDFAWVNGDGTLADGWEGSGSLAPGTYTARAHILVADDSADGYTPMDPIGRDVPLVIECAAVEPTATPTPTATPAPVQTPTPTGTPDGGVGGSTPTPPTPPGGGVGGATATPRSTLPPTDAVGTPGTPAASQDGVRLVLILLGVAITGSVLITQTRRRQPVEVVEEITD